MSSKYLDLYVDQGADFIKTLRLTSESNNANINIASSIFTSKIRKGPLTMNAADSITVSILNPANGTILLSIASANTANLEPGRYLYDIIQTEPVTNYKTRIYEGICMVTAGVTR